MPFVFARRLPDWYRRMRERRRRALERARQAWDNVYDYIADVTRLRERKPDVTVGEVTDILDETVDIYVLLIEEDDEEFMSLL